MPKSTILETFNSPGSIPLSRDKKMESKDLKFIQMRL